METSLQAALIMAVEKAMADQGLTEIDLASQVGLTQKQLSRMLSGHTPSTLITWGRLLDHLGLVVQIAPPGEPPPAADLWNMSDIAKHLGVAVSTVMKYRDDGQLPYPIYRHSQRIWLWRASDIRAWWLQREDEVVRETAHVDEQRPPPTPYQALAHERFAERNAQIIARVAAGETKASVARDVGITRARVDQIVKKAQISTAVPAEDVEVLPVDVQRTSGVEWVDAPPDRQRRGKWHRICDGLRAKPGQWAKVSEAKNTAFATMLKQGRLGGAKPGEFKAECRRNASGRYDIYACYVGD